MRLRKILQNSLKILELITLSNWSLIKRSIVIGSLRGANFAIWTTKSSPIACMQHTG